VSIPFFENQLILLIRIDKDGFFAEPVDPKIVVDYLDIIKNPMDFSTILKKLDDHEYISLEQMEVRCVSFFAFFIKIIDRMM
jgi:bromodomain-containing protein 9